MDWLLITVVLLGTKTTQIEFPAATRAECVAMAESLKQTARAIARDGGETVIVVPSCLPTRVAQT